MPFCTKYLFRVITYDAVQHVLVEGVCLEFTSSKPPASVEESFGTAVTPPPFPRHLRDPGIVFEKAVFSKNQPEAKKLHET